MKSHYSYLKVSNVILEKLKSIQDQISDPTSKIEILNVLLNMGIRIVSSDSRSAQETLLNS
jgi:hypothetical protein